MSPQKRLLGNETCYCCKENLNWFPFPGRQVPVASIPLPGTGNPAHQQDTISMTSAAVAGRRPTGIRKLDTGIPFALTSENSLIPSIPVANRPLPETGKPETGIPSLITRFSMPSKYKPFEFPCSEFLFPCTSHAQCIDQCQRLVEIWIIKGSLDQCWI